MADTREYYQGRAMYWCREARRAIAFAHRDLILGDRKSYTEWMGNAVWLLTEAATWREEARQLPWTQRSEMEADMSDSFLEQVKKTPILYRHVSDVCIFMTLLKMRTIVWERHYKDTMMLLCRADRPATFGMLFDNDFLLALCNGEEEQKSFKADIEAYSFYSGLINKFHIRDLMYETRRASSVKVKDWQYKERKKPTNISEACLHSPPGKHSPCPKKCGCWCDDCEAVRKQVITGH